MADKKQTKSVLSQSTSLTSGSALALGSLMAKNGQPKRKKSVGKSTDAEGSSSSVKGASVVAGTAPALAPIEEPMGDTENRNASQQPAAKQQKNPSASKSVLSQSTGLTSGSAMALGSLMAKDSGSKRTKDTEKVKEQEKVATDLQRVAVPDAVEHVDNAVEDVDNAWTEVTLDDSRSTPSPPAKVGSAPKENLAAGPHQNLVEFAPKPIPENERYVLQNYGGYSREEDSSWKCCSQTDNYELELHSRPTSGTGPRYEAPAAPSGTLFQRYCEEPVYKGSTHVRECIYYELSQELSVA